MSQSLKRVNNVWYLCAVLCLGYAFFMVGLVRAPVPTVDGSIRAVEARTMVRSGQWFPVVYQGSVVTDHPPLYVWLSALSFKVFGISDVAANLPGRLCALLTVFFIALIALRVGSSGRTALVTALILCLTRDFVLSSVRGYIEPLVECLTYGGLWLVLYQRESHRLWPSFFAGVFIFLAAFAKGPPALWPFLFLGILLALNWRALGAYLGGVIFCVASWAWWNEHYHYWIYWHQYLFGQVISSAMEGRGGSQHFEPLYFLKILATYYWPWLLFLGWSIMRMSRLTTTAKFNSLLFFIFGFGFVAGFSLVKWKFWYYIAPAYPAFSLFIALSFQDKLPVWTKKSFFPKSILVLTLTWILIASVFPIPLHRDRVPEVTAFKEIIRSSSLAGPVWFTHDPMDHNLVGTSGEWYFDRLVIKVDDEKKWAKTHLISPSWIITGADFWPTCHTDWCKHSKLVATAGKSSLVYYDYKKIR